MPRATILTAILGFLPVLSCRSTDPTLRNDVEPSLVPVEFVGRARYFNNCGIVIRPAVTYDVSFLVSDVARAGDYVEFLRLSVNVPPGRAGRLSVLDSNKKLAAVLDKGVTSVEFRLRQKDPSDHELHWRVGGSGSFKPYSENGSGTYCEKSAFRQPEPERVNSENPRRPELTKVKFYLYGVESFFFLQDD